MSKTVFAFGRMNPPTVGHEKLAKKVSDEARKRKAMPHIYLSHSQDKKKNPLSYNDKIKYASRAFGKMVTKSSSKTIIQVMQDLQRMGHTEVVLIAGSDRVQEFKTFLNKYNGKDYTFDKIEVVSAGERDPDAEGVEGMSGTKLRGLAQSGDFDQFKTGLASKLNDNDKKKIYNIIRTINSTYSESIEDDILSFTDKELDDMYDDLMEDEDDWDDIDWAVNDTDTDFTEANEFKPREPLTLQQRQKKRIQMRRLAPIIARKRAIALRKKATGDKLVKRSRKAAIMILKKKVAGKRGANYQNLKPGEKIAIDRLVAKKMGMVGKIARKLLPAVKKKENERFKNLNKNKTNEEFTNYLDEAFPIQISMKDKTGKTHKTSTTNLRGATHALLIHYKETPGVKGNLPGNKEGQPPKTNITLGTEKHLAKVAKQMLKKHPSAKYAIGAEVVKLTQKMVTGADINEEFTNYLFELYFKVDVEGLPSVYIEAPSASTIKSDLRKVIRDPGENIKSIDRVERGAIVKAFRLRAQNPGAPLEVEEEVSPKQLSDLEKFGDRILAKFGVDITFSRHFADRMNDARNKPEIKIAELQGLFKKIAKKKAVNIKKYPNAEVVLKDIQKDLNLPIAIKVDKDGTLEVVHKTIMRKKNFGTPDPVISYESLEEGVNDPGIFKAVFLAGGPGSGKSFIVDNTGLASLGLKVVNVDDVFERALKKAGLDTTPDDIFSPKGQELRGKTKTTTNNRQEGYLKGRLGLVLDGTGKDYNKIATQANKLKRMGYEVAMIFVNTDLETALTRNRNRKRTLPDDKVTTMWKEVQKNLGKFQNYFGANFIIVDNSEGVDSKSITLAAYKKISKWIKKSPSTRTAKNWISQEKSRRGINEAYEAYLEEKTIEGLKNKAEKSGISYGILKKVYDRGMGAWKTSHRPGTTPQQWAFARVNSFMSGGKTQKTTDSDLWAKVKKESVGEGKTTFRRDKKIPNLIVKTKTTDFEFSQYMNKNTGRRVDYFKSLKDIRKEDTVDEKFTMYLEGAEEDIARERHAVERERLKTKHDREMDAARLADTKKKNLKT